MSRFAIAVFVLTLSINTLSTINASAHIGATGIVKERMDTMSEMGRSLGVIAGMIKGNAPFDSVVARHSALVLHDHALSSSKQYPDTPESRNGIHSQATSSVWSERLRFNNLMKNLQEEAKKLAQTAKLNDLAVIRIQFGEIVRICSDCHEKFRKPKQN